MHEPVLDTLGMFDLAAGLPGQVADTARVAGEVDLPAPGGIDNVVVLGAGTSAIAGEALCAAAYTRSPAPFSVVSGYVVPAHIGSGTLVIALSYSGDTEETVAATLAAFEVGATVVGVTSGGRLAEVCEARRAPVVPLPEGRVSRAMFGALTVAPAVTASRLGLLPGVDEDVSESVGLLGRAVPKLRLGAPEAANRAFRIATMLDRRMPMIWGSFGPSGAAANFWKCQINENAKAQACWNMHPEVGHNEIAGFGQHGDVTRQLLAIVELRSSHEHPQVRRRFEITRDFVEECVGPIESVRTEADSALGAFFDLAVVGDFTSLYLAALATVDPGPADVLDGLEGRLADAP